MRRVVLVMLGVTALVGACSSREPSPDENGTRSAATTAAPRLTTEADFKRIYDPMLEPLGLRLSRAGLTEQAGDDAYSTGGSHAALYVVPLSGADTSPDAYLERMPDLARAIIPDVFRRLSVTTVDLCQEPPATPGGEPGPPETVMLVSRVQSSKLDWPNVTVADLVAMHDEGPARASVVVSDRVRTTNQWRRLSEQA